MFKSITIGQFIPGNSVLHRLDPRAKFIALIIFIVSIFVVQSFLGYLALAGILFALLLTSELPLPYFFRGLRPVYFITLFTLLVHFFMTRGGEVLLQIGPLSIESQGVYLGFFMVFRIIFLVVSTSLLTLTTSPIALTDGLEYLMKPLTRIGVPSHEIAMMMTIALRFIPTLMEESEKIMKAQMARGADFTSGSVFKRAKNLVPLLVPLFVSAFRRADDLAVAMEARCYRGGEGRTRLRELVAAPRDYAAIATSTVILVGLILLGI
ncbi:energy-coupling factor transporter transmembrane component T family protein [Dethiobacter alkaliphilus]|uniref:energy-coupling factor transporter transmembrane component T family protein n=1 Tax=Dethiobacter alkaliphilus TaxID=427926 RepID=UPI00222796D5|nr:energy-coupling factor transporter transmembrane component T [Dethiobacter alkaliphilus]MCW3491115.1 energy-coupling factor transporter transmembrane protein EcfT [Dethiobacter alkaliphilus]